jgi:uncharacterized protein (DUF1499 family)
MRVLRLVVTLLVLLPGTAMAALFGNLFAGTPPTNLGAKAGVLAPCPDTPNCVNSQARDDGHRIAPIAYAGDTAAAMARLVRVIAEQPGTVLVIRRIDYVYATFQTPVMGFVDDVEFLADPPQQAIQVRSASRIGHSDLGVNRKRVEAMRVAFAAATR